MNIEELVKKCKEYQPDPKTLLAAILLQHGGKLTVGYDHLLEVCNSARKINMVDSVDGLVVTIEKQKFILDDDEMLDKLVRSDHVGSC